MYPTIINDEPCIGYYDFEILASDGIKSSFLARH